MKRRIFVAIVNGTERHTFAWNSAISATEDMVREIARTEGQMYSGGTVSVTGGKPATPGAIYWREWTGDVTHSRVMATVSEVL